MKHRFKFLSTTFLIGLLTMSISCKDQFTEEDALNAQQLIDLAIYVYNESNQERPPVAGATVAFVQGGNKLEATTDENGVALFNDVKFGGFVYTITAQNFTTVTEDGYLYADDFRQSQETYSIGIYSLNDESLATIKGIVRIETDLTNDTPETMEGIVLTFRSNLNNGSKIFTATTDANGNYEVKVPVNSYGSTVYMKFQDILAPQKIAFNKLSTDPKSFPEVLPQVGMVETLFAMYDGDRFNYNNYPVNDVNPIYAIAEAAPTGQTTAVIGRVYTTDGVIDDIDFINGGNYAGDTDGKVTITFTSLVGGSGATLVVTLGDQTNLSNAFNEVGTATIAFNGGSGYPETFYDLNRVGYQGPSLDTQSRETSFYLYPGTQTIVNPHYGTGVSRPNDLD